MENVIKAAIYPKYVSEAIARQKTHEVTKMDWKKYFKQTSAAMVAGTLIFSGSAALANEESVSLNQVNHKEQAATVDPGLTSDNFFYFIDKFFENVSLLLTFDDKEKVQKYTEYASEKIAEAEKLFSAGDEEKAVETLNDALKYMSQAEEDAAEEETDENTEEQENTEPATDETEEDASEETEEEEDVTEEGTEDAAQETEEQVLQVTLEDLQTQNIIALTQALEHVKNPVARAALQKNIEKTYAKVIKKLEKLGYVVEIVEEAEETEETAEETTEGTDNAVEEETTESEESAVEENVEAPVVNKAKAEKKAVKKEAKEVKQEAKQEQKAAKTEAKQERKAAKEETTQQKKTEVKQGKENSQAKSNGQGNGKGPQN